MSLSRPRVIVPLAAALIAVVGAARGQSIAGAVTDARGQPLAYVTVGISGSSAGATTGDGGAYRLALAGGDGFGDSLTLDFRTIGYAPARRTVARPAPGATVRVDVRLREATYTLGEATVSADAEDPAYRIMREAAARRREYLLAPGPYEVDVYVKGQIKVTDAPERILGQDIGDMGGLLDSARAGIMYLSETYSKLAARPPDDVRETIVASQVAGDPQGYSYNTAAGVNFDLYRRVSDYGKPVLTVLAEEAPRTYRFELLGSRRVANGRLVHRIAVGPRGGAFAPAYHGEVYVEEGSFHLVDADLYLLGPALGRPGLDTLAIAQSYRRRPGSADTVWEVTQRRIEPRFSLIGFRFGGAFTAVYSDYDYAPAWAAEATEDAPFGRVVTEVLPESNAVDSARFAARPIPLTRAERRDYARKDSIRRVRESPAYRDSVQARGNRLRVGAIAGYTRDNWRTRERWTVLSPLTQNGYHTATGLRLGIGLGYERALDDERTRAWDLGATLAYGNGDERWYPTARVGYRWDPRYRREVRLEGGRDLADYHRLTPVSTEVNALYNSFAKRNPLKVYERRFARARHVTDLNRPGQPPLARLAHALTLERRVPRVNVDDYSLLNKDRTYDPNFPEVAPGAFDSMRASTIVGYAGEVSFVPGRRYLARPDGFVAVDRGGPTLSVAWRYGREVGGAADELDYLFAEVGLRRDAVRLARAGYLSARLGAGTALWYEGPEHPVDLKLFGGSELNVNVYADYLTRFLSLPHYGLATRGPWVDGTVEHDFDGVLWRRLPLLRRLGWEFVGRAGGIYVPGEERGHGELGVGVDDVGFGLFRLLRFDVAWPYRYGYGAAEGADLEGWGGPMWRLGIGLPDGFEVN